MLTKGTIRKSPMGSFNDPVVTQDQSLGNERLYLNLQSYNANQGFQVNNSNYTFLQPTITDPSAWTVSVISFQIPGNTIPLLNLISYLTDDQTDPDNYQLDYQVRMDYKGDTYTQHMLIPRTWAYSPTFIPLWTYVQFYRQLNEALSLCCDQVNVDHPATIAFPPFMTYVESTGLFQLWAPTTPFDIYGTDPVRIAFDNVLYSLFQSLPDLPDTFSDSKNWVELDVSKYPIASGDTKVPLTNENSWLPDGKTATNYLVMTQENDTRCRWVGLRYLYITTDLPVKSEWLQVGKDEGAQSQQKILAQYNVDTNTVEYVCSIFYTAAAEFRRVSMGNTNSAIQNINMKIYYTDNNLNTSPLYINSHESLIIKLLFERYRADLPDRDGNQIAH